MTDRIQYEMERRVVYENISFEEAQQRRDDEVLLDRTEEFADTVAYIASSRASYLTVSIISVDGG